MKNLELEQMGVREMDAVEMKRTDGGLFGIDDLFWIGLGIGILLGWITVRERREDK